MSFGVFMHKDGSGYADIPELQYQFPKTYLGRAQQIAGSWVVYLEPAKERGSKGYFAVAKVSRIEPDRSRHDHYLAVIEPGTYLPFSPTVPRRLNSELVERDCPNPQWAVRPLSDADFVRIVSLGLPNEEVLPRIDSETQINRVREDQLIYEVERPIVASLVNRPFRDRAFRHAVLEAYDKRCALTGWKLINGGGRAEAEAAHIRPVEQGGPDSVRNGLALSGTAHWMFDRGLISFSDDFEVLISRHVNDRQSVEAIINPTGKALVPHHPSLRPHPIFLDWHRTNCFKH